MPPEVALVLGTRPEIIKLSPIIRECESRDIAYTVIHTGQHYSDELDAVFFEQLELPKPDVNLEVGSGDHGEQTAAMLAGIERELVKKDPDVLFVQGDTNSTLAGAIAASKLDPTLAHVEAGLRSFDRKMPEETNRVLADHVSEYLFAPTDTAAGYLRQEGRPEESIYVTGNTVVDAVQQNREIATEKSEILTQLGVTPGEYAVMTAHRAENVDNADTFQRILTRVGHAAEKADFDVIYPVHPRAQDRIESFDLEIPEPIRLEDPLNYLDFLQLEAHAALLLTDSGGVQEEGCILGVPCLTLRESTERPETVDVGANVLVGTGSEPLIDDMRSMLETDRTWSNPYGDGRAAEQILTIIENEEWELISMHK